MSKDYCNIYFLDSFSSKVKRRELAFDPNFENKNNEPKDSTEDDNDPFGGNDFGDGFDDEFGGL